MSATLMVRATVPEGDREAFDRWYREEHLPDALAAFSARAAWRGWSDVDPGVHYAFYELESLERLREITGSDTIAQLIAEFDRVWEGRVERSREVIEVRQRLEALIGLARLRSRRAAGLMRVRFLNVEQNQEDGR